MSQIQESAEQFDSLVEYMKMKGWVETEDGIYFKDEPETVLETWREAIETCIEIACS